MTAEPVKRLTPYMSLDTRHPETNLIWLKKTLKYWLGMCASFMDTHAQFTKCSLLIMVRVATNKLGTGPQSSFFCLYSPLSECANEHVSDGRGLSGQTTISPPELPLILVYSVLSSILWLPLTLFSRYNRFKCILWQNVLIFTSLLSGISSTGSSFFLICDSRKSRLRTLGWEI